MDLLPKAHKEFSSKSYWERFFKKRGTKAFEWYGEYSSFCGLLAKYAKVNEKILEIGCGNSDLSSQMHDFGYKQLTCIDISSVVIQQMKQKNSTQRPSISYLEMNLFNTSFQDGEFGVVLDKGTLDAIYSEDIEEKREEVLKMFVEVERLLRLGGRYICFSLAQPFILKILVSHFLNLGWLTRVCLINTEDREDVKEEKQFYLPVFMFIFTKFKKLPNSNPILETAFFEGKVERVESEVKLVESIEHLQNYAWVRQNLKNKKLSNEEGEELNVELFDSSHSHPRYSIFIVDGKGNKYKKFAIFIVPQGRENEWLFNSKEGREQLHKSCGHVRLLVVLLNRFHDYKSLDEVKMELSGKVLELAPPDAAKQSPFLTLSQSISVRKVVEEGRSRMSGDYVVEDVTVELKVYRRLVFSSSPLVVQSEVLLKRVVKRGAKKSSRIEEHIPDHSHLTSCYYAYVVMGISFVTNLSSLIKEPGLKVALLGLGGGSLAMYFKKAFKNIKIHAVELDESIVKVANKWFGLEGLEEKVEKMEEKKDFTQEKQINFNNEKNSSNLIIRVGDGIQFVEEKEERGEKYDVVIVDVDNKEQTSGFSCPPISFLQKDFLDKSRNLISEGGVFILNLATRSEKNKEFTRNQLVSSFSKVSYFKVLEDINEIYYCQKIQQEQNKENFSKLVDNIRAIDKSYVETLSNCDISKVISIK